MLNKKAKVKGEILAIEDNGLGFMQVHKDKVYVKQVLVGEVVEAIITKKIKEGYIADVVKVIKPSSIRTKVKCPYFTRCGSCNYLHMLYPFELKLKTEQVKGLVEQYHLPMQVHNCEGMKEPYAYRNKLILSFGKSRKNEVVSGFYEPYSHKLVNIANCLLHDKKSNDLIAHIKDCVKKCRIDVYDEATKRGFLKHVQLRENQKGEFLVTIVVADKEFKGKKKFIDMLLDGHSEIVSIVQNINNRHTVVVLGNEEVVLYGKGYIEDTLCGLTFRISSKSFYQINHEQCEKLYTKALSMLKLNGTETVVDTYSGIGTISLLLAKQAKKVYGVEINAQAVKDANVNKEINGIQNVDFVCSDSGEYMQRLARVKQAIDVVVMDPARDGADKNFIDALLTLKPKHILYISCNPETQMRDIKQLNRVYNCKTVELFDMFPRTNHVESVVLMTRKNG